LTPGYLHPEQVDMKTPLLTDRGGAHPRSTPLDIESPLVETSVGVRGDTFFLGGRQLEQDIQIFATAPLDLRW
jgi:hypothetical protein